jgi:hypothetical protein
MLSTLWTLVFIAGDHGVAEILARHGIAVILCAGRLVGMIEVSAVYGVRLPCGVVVHGTGILRRPTVNIDGGSEICGKADRGVGVGGDKVTGWLAMKAIGVVVLTGEQIEGGEDGMW